MRKTLLLIAALTTAFNTAMAIDDNKVEIVYNGNTATVTIANNISSYVTVQSDNSSHVKLVQSESFAGVDKTANNEDGEITYVLSGTSTDGSFYMEGSFKATVELDNLTLANPSGAAIAIMDGKRIAVSVKKGTTNSLTDGANETYNGCFHCKGHTKFKGKGTLNVTGNSKHAIYSKEYIEVKNCTLNIQAEVKDAIHCKEYFMQESGLINITKAGDDGIQVELDDNSPATGVTVGHEDENTGNFYQEDGTLRINGFAGSAIKADGTVELDGSYSGFKSTDITENNATGIDATPADHHRGNRTTVCDLQGRRLARTAKGICLVRTNGTVKKVLMK